MENRDLVYPSIQYHHHTVPLSSSNRRVYNSSSSPQLVPPSTHVISNIMSSPEHNENYTVNDPLYYQPNILFPSPSNQSARQARRYRSIKKYVNMPQGKLVLDCPVPIQYLEKVPLRDGREFNTMRYTSITCDPSQFLQNNYTLRQQIMKRHTEIVICITMYNENEILLSRTLHGIMRNITRLTKRKRSHMWGKDSWQKIVICIIADGREKVNRRVLDMLSVLGVYQEGIAKSTVNRNQVHAHLYEYTSQLSITPDLSYRGAMDDIVPAQVIFCLKEENQKKINSHRWFFQAICPILQPNVCLLMDVGTEPGPNSIHQLWLPFDRYKDVGGACGEVRAMTGRAHLNLLHPLVAAQHFEYKISNILDKPLESLLGYIQVLPGAFSAYRYAAIQNDSTGQGPLATYFLGDHTAHPQSTGIFEANMYLAEDRILCYEVVAKRNAQWRLHYVMDAYGETDVPFTVAEFVNQRRRWLNGSFFAGVYSLVHWGKILSTKHTPKRKLLLIIELIYLCIQWLFSWFNLGNFFISFFILTGSLSKMENPPFSPNTANTVHKILTYIYGILMMCILLIAIGNRPQGSQLSYGIVIVFFALLMIYVIFASTWIVYQGIAKALANETINLLSSGPFRDILMSLGSTTGVFILSGLLYFDPWHMITSFVPYLLLSPSYTNLLNTYAFCNTHDVSWGTKNSTTVTYLGHVETTADQIAEVLVPEATDVGLLYEASERNLKTKTPNEKSLVDPRTQQDDYFRNFRTWLVICWICSNLVLIILICYMNNVGRLGSFDEQTNVYLSFLLWSVAGLYVFRFIGSTIFRIISFF